MTTNYSGNLSVSGGIFASDGESAIFSGTFGITLSASFDSSGTGSGTETVNGTVNVQYVYADGSTGSNTIPLDLPSLTIQTQLGSFQVNEQLPTSFAGLQFGVDLTGTVSRDLSQITENITGTASGTYQGFQINGSISSSGTLTAAPPPPSPVSIGGAGGSLSTSDTSAVAPFSAVAVSDPNAGATDTIRITVSNPANGTLSDLGSGSFNASTGVFTVSGSAASVDAAVRGLVFTPTTHQAGTGQTVTTNFTISVSDTVGQSASGGTTSVVTTETLLGALSVSQQLELIYVAYFSRAADGAGFAYWSGQNVSAQNAGQSAAVALTNIANSFAPQAETIALYSFLGTAGGSLNTPAAQTGLASFVGAVYKNLFGHAADAAGQSYWAGQITNGAVGLGAAALAIANGATGTDAITVQNKVAVALDFTTRTGAAGLGESGPLPSAFLTTAASVLAGVDGSALNDASVTTAEAATTAYTAHPTAAAAMSGTLLGQAAAGPAHDAPPGAAAAADPAVITISGAGQSIDPGAGNSTIRFLAGANDDTLVARADAMQQVFGFDPATDVLDLRSLLAAANIDLSGGLTSVGNYVGVTDQGMDALVTFDPGGQGVGSTVAVLHGAGLTVTSLDSLMADGALRLA